MTDKHKREHGFNMIELMVTLVVVSVVITLGAPAMTNFIADMRLSATTNDVLSFFNYARSEAAKRGARVTICISSDLSACAPAATDWAVGALAYIDGDNNAQVSSGETVLRVMNPIPGNVSITPTSAFTTNFYFYYRPSGAANSQGTLRICRSGRNARDVSINAVGRPISQTTATVCS